MQLSICKHATAARDHDNFAHCRPQVDFVGMHGEEVEDLFYCFRGVDAYLQKHGYRLVTDGENAHNELHRRHTVNALTQEQRLWINTTYADDFALIQKRFGHLACDDVAHARRVESTART